MNIARIVLTVFIVSVFAILVFSPPIPVLEKSSEKTENLQQVPGLFNYPVRNENFQSAQQISARSAVVIDAKTGVVLFEKNPDIPHLPASTAKLMTALVALEKCAPQDLVTVGFIERVPTAMGLETGDIITIETLLYGLLVASGNDAAFALSYSCAASTLQFVQEMNLKAKELEMKNTYFQNPAGFDSPNQFTTALDLAKLAKVAVANPLIAKIVSTKEINLKDANGIKDYKLSNINALLGTVEGVEGIKTGLTEGSLQILITQTTRENNTIIAVVLGSEDRFLDSTALIEWTFNNHNWKDLD